MKNTREPLAREGHLEYDRVLFFNDAVFAIALGALAPRLRQRNHLAPTIFGVGCARDEPALIQGGHDGCHRLGTYLFGVGQCAGRRCSLFPEPVDHRCLGRCQIAVDPDVPQPTS